MQQPQQTTNDSDFVAGADKVHLSDKTPTLGAGIYPKIKVLRAGMVQGLSDKRYEVVGEILEAKEGATNAVGSTAKIMFIKDKFNYYIKDLAFFAAAVTGQTPDRAKNTLPAFITPESSAALVGLEFGTETNNKKDQKTGELKRYGSGEPVVTHRFRAVDGQAQKYVAALAKIAPPAKK